MNETKQCDCESLSNCCGASIDTDILIGHIKMSKPLEDYCTPEDEPIIDLIEGIVRTSYSFDRHLTEMFPESTTWNDKTGWQ